jgi:hypothetical protein
MPGGNKNITAADGKPFSATNQPKNRRKSTKFLTDLLTKELKGKTEIIIAGFDPETGKPAKIKVPMPTRQNIVQALLRQASKGNIHAIREVFDRVEGKVSQSMELTGAGGKDLFENMTDEELKAKMAQLEKAIEE